MPFSIYILQQKNNSIWTSEMKLLENIGENTTPVK